jgi:chloride channel protein, CIC family
MTVPKVVTEAPGARPAAGQRRSRLRRLIFAVLLFARHQIRASELWMVLIAAGVGALAGLATLAVSQSARVMQILFYNIDPEARLSAVASVPLLRLAALPVGGLVLALITIIWVRRRPGSIVDPVEANALRGGRMSVRDSLFLGVQSVISNGFGASVGLEAAYAQLGACIGSFTGGRLNLRRSDLRTFVGAGAGAGIAAAFGAPLTGAFYAFEIIIGSYTIANIAPVVAAALAGALVTRLLHVDSMVIHTSVTDTLRVSHYLLFAALGLICALFGVGVMRMVALTEDVASKLPVPKWSRPAIGGLALAALAWTTPQTLSAGHGAMHLDFTADLAISALVFLILAKAAASVIALGFGFRGGLFFASLYLGSLLGRLFILGLDAAGLDAGIDPMVGALVGMGALAVSIIGGPFTMSFLVLETTGDFGLTAATLTASIVASVLVRETFGYSFSTWRLHLRGETIRSAHDVGWLRTLTAGRMMRGGAPTASSDITVDEFRRRFPLGSTRRVVALDDGGRYAGIIPVSAVYADQAGAEHVGQFAINQAQSLTPEMTIKEIMGVFDRTQSDELVVVDDDREVLGILSEAYATRRYAEELERARRDLVGGE